MNEAKNNVCCGCLAFDRRMLLVEDRSIKQCFYQILGELPLLNMNDRELQLCWECEKYTRKWNKFKEQVTRAYKAMHNFGLSLSSTVQSSLTAKKLYHFGITPFEEETDMLQIKEEKDDDIDTSDNNYYVTHILHDYDNQSLTVNSLPKNEINLSNNYTCQTKNDSCQISNDSLHSNVNSLVEIEINLSNTENNLINNSSDVSENEVFSHSCDTNDTNLTDVKLDKRNNEFLMASSKVSAHRRIGKMKGQREKNLNRKGSLKKRKIEKISKLYREVRLSKEELMNERETAKIKEDYVNAMFKCERCITSFPNADDLADHITLKHELHASKHKCSLCECSFASIVSYNYHQKKHRTRYECLACNERYMTSHAATKHHEMAHWNSIDANDMYTRINAKLPKELQNPEDIIDDGNDQSERFPCELCNKTFKWKTSLRKHVETHCIQTGLKRKPYCEPCSLSFSTTANLRKHVRSSSNHQVQLKLIKLKETQSDDPSNSEKQVARIKQIKTSVLKSTQQFRCPHCERMFQWRGNLQRHIANHAARASGKLVCKPCNRKFSSIETYNQHMKISKKHVTENVFKFVCNECGKRFFDKIKLKDHIDWEHLKNYVHICTICDKVFKSRTSLFLHHKAVHKKDKLEYLCDHCGKVFSNQGRLRSHAVLHTNKTPYKCVICPARFNWKACLTRHVKKVHDAQNKHKQDGGA